MARDGEEGLALALEGDFDLVLLDLILPGLHGHEVCQQLRIKQLATPLIILTAMDSVDDIVTGLRLGADDYMTKPFSFEELLARIESVMRRTTERSAEDPCLKIGPLVLDRQSLRVLRGDEEIHLTAKELAILELLMTHPGTLFSRERILSNVWGLNMDPLTNIVDVYIGKLRKKIDGGSPASMIETVRGLGYRLSPP